MRAQSIESSVIESNISEATDSVYLLLETEFFEDPWVDVCDIDFGTAKRWLWEDTFLDAHKNYGPLLVGLDKNSPLVSTFIEQWSANNAAILIVSPHEIEKLIQHLQSLILIMLPDGTHAKMRIQEPRKLAGIVNSLHQDNDHHSFMGPIKQIIWRENCGKRILWYQTNNDKVHEPKHTKDDLFWFQFHKEQMKIIDTHEAQYFVHQLAWKLSDKFNLDIEDAKMVSNQHTKEARQNGFLGDNEMEHYVTLRMEFGDFTKDKDVQAILKDKEYEPAGRMQQVRIHLENSSEGALS